MKTKTKILHFRVDPNILNIIRQAYWYEEGKKEWAMDCLRSLGGNMTLDLAHDLLEGKNGLMSNDDGITLTTTDKPDVEFQKELAEHRKLLEEGKKKIDRHAQRPYCNNDASMEFDCKYKKDDGKCMYSRMEGYKTSHTSCEGGECYLDKSWVQKERIIKAGAKMMGLDKPTIATGEKVADKKGNKCLVEGCEFCMNNKCSFGMRDNWGCYQEKDVKEKFAEFKMQMTSIGIRGVDGMNFVKSEAGKIFSFDFKGHTYGFRDSARDQGSCPHCDHQAADNFWKPTDNAYIGHKYFGMKINILGKEEKAYAVCFQCPKCNKKFFYHSNYKR